MALGHDQSTLLKQRMLLELDVPLSERLNKLKDLCPLKLEPCLFHREGHLIAAYKMQKIGDSCLRLLIPSEPYVITWVKAGTKITKPASTEQFESLVSAQIQMAKAVSGMKK